MGSVVSSELVCVFVWSALESSSSIRTVDGIYSEVSEIILKKPECLRLYSLTESLIKLSQTTINSPTLWPSSVLITVYFLVGLIRVVRFRMWWNMCQELHTPELIAYYNIASYWKKYCCHHWKSEGVQNKESFKISFSRTTAPIRHQTCTVMVSQVNKDCNKFYRMIFFSGILQSVMFFFRVISSIHLKAITVSLKH